MPPDRRFRSRHNLEQWARNQVERYVRSGREWRHIEELVAGIWRDGYRCGDADRRADVAVALGLKVIPPLAAIAVEPWEGAERIQRSRP